MFKWCIMFLVLGVCQCRAQDKENNPKSKFPSELDYFRSHVPDSLKYLLPRLDSVFDDDQRYRDNSNMASAAQHKQEIALYDSINLTKIVPIIDRYGILGPKDIGFKGNLAIVMTLQHSSEAVHAKYLPLIEEAFTKKKVTPGQYAMFVDRTLLGKGQMQIYGTQVAIDSKLHPELKPIINPDSIDIRRSSIGISESIASYLKRFGITWNVEQYKTDLPSLKKKYHINQ